MATIDDVGVPGQPLSTPPLTEWQKAVRDAIKANQAGSTITLGTVTPVSGWADLGGMYAGLQATKQGRMVTVNALLKPTSDKAVSAGVAFDVANVPAAMVPSTAVILSGIYATAGAAPLVCRFTVQTSGLVQCMPAVAGTILAATGWVAVSITYRSAT